MKDRISTLYNICKILGSIRGIIFVADVTLLFVGLVGPLSWPSSFPATVYGYLFISTTVTLVFIILLCARLNSACVDMIFSMISMEKILTNAGFEEVTFSAKVNNPENTLTHLGLAHRTSEAGMIVGKYGGRVIKSSHIKNWIDGYRGGRINLYKGRITTIHLNSVFAETVLLVRATAESVGSSSGMTKSFRRQMVNVFGFNKTREYVLVGAAWSAYSSRVEYVKELFLKEPISGESKLVSMLNESMIDFILLYGMSIIFGSQTSLILDRYGVSESAIQKSVLESIQNFIDEINTMLLFEKVSFSSDDQEAPADLTKKMR